MPPTPAHPPLHRLRAALVGGVAAVSVLTGCSGGGRTALAIEGIRWHDDTTLVVATECSTEVEVEVGPDHSGTGLPEVTVWGEPSLGTCRPEAEATIPAGTTRIVDGSTSMVIDLPQP